MSERLHHNTTGIRQSNEHSGKNTVLIFRERLLGYSETFILSHYLSLRKFKPVFAGIVNENQIDLAACRRITVNTNGSLIGLVREIAYKVFGFEPLLYAAIKRYDPALIHVHFGMDAARFLPSLSLLKRPFVVTFHGTDASTSDEWKMRSGSSYHKRYVAARHELMQKATMFIAVSHHVKKKLLEQGYPEDRIKVVYLGVDTVQFAPDESSPRSKNILFVGRLIENKGCRYLIEAMGTVQRKFPRSKLIVVGDGPLKGELEQYAKKMSVNVDFVGRKSHAETRRIMNECYILSVPSIQIAGGASEGLGLVFCEAQSMGLPVVAFVTGGVPEAVVHGRTGFLCEPGNSEGLSLSIEQLLDDEKLWKEYSAAARNHIEANFNSRKCASQLESLYTEIILKQSAASRDVS